MQLDKVPITHVKELTTRSCAGFDDITNLDSPSMQHIPVSVVNTHEFTLHIFCVPDDPGQRKLQDNFDVRKQSRLEIIHPDGTVVASDVHITEIKSSVGPKGVTTMKVTLRGIGPLETFDPNVPVDEVEDYDMARRF